MKMILVQRNANDFLLLERERLLVFHLLKHDHKYYIFLLYKTTNGFVSMSKYISAFLILCMYMLWIRITCIAIYAYVHTHYIYTHICNISVYMYTHTLHICRYIYIHTYIVYVYSVYTCSLNSL